eukprot:TRINITY_DN16972_c0_g1_i1.p1 TRINITY_DN16972_c0_g1~~TRINITY_DN16972_c0_g1_i1.p1  ORF type:complete len:1074 (-),score=193.09 TRINITY_DN16972_c0_g1_i1:69-2945(-)
MARSSPVAYKPDADGVTRVSDQKLVFPTHGESELSVSVRNKRSLVVQGVLVGNPIVGDGKVALRKAVHDLMEVKVPIFRNDNRRTGSVTLRVQLMAAPEPQLQGSGSERRDGEFFGLRIDCLRNVHFSTPALESGPAARKVMVKVTVRTSAGEVLARATTHGAMVNNGVVTLDEVLRLPSEASAPRSRARSFCPANSSSSPADWDLKDCSVALSVKGTLPTLWTLGRCVIPLADLISRPTRKLLVSGKDANVVLCDATTPPTPMEMQVSVVASTLPSEWPKPRESERYTATTYPHHVFILTRGTRGDVQPFVALARGMAEQRGWLVTICTELRWRDFVKKHSNVSRGRIRFRSSGGDTEANMSARLSQWAIACKADAMQMMIMAATEANFFPSAPVFNHHVLEAQFEPKPVDLLVFGLTCAGIAAVLSEHFKIPLVGFILQPSCIPSEDTEWTAVQHLVQPSQLPPAKLLSLVQEKVFTGHGTLGVIKHCMERSPLDNLNLNQMRKWYGLPPIDTWDLFKTANVPIVIPIQEGTFKRPADWWSNVCLTEFIFLRQPGSSSAAHKLAEPLGSFVANAKAASAKLCLMTFSSMPVARPVMLRCAVKMVESCKFNVRLVYVGPKQGEVPEDLQPRVKTLSETGRLLEVDRADFGVLFAQMDCFVVHGGLGTTVEALRIGKPICVTGPLLLDQRFWGSVCASKNVGPEYVHIDDFEKTCVEFVNGALDPTDPHGWQQSALEGRDNWGDADDDGVAANVDVFADMLSVAGRQTIKVQLSRLDELVSPAYFPNLPRITGERRLSRLSVELQIGRRSEATQPRAAEPVAPAMTMGVDLTSEAPVVFPYNGEDNLTIEVWERPAVLGFLKGTLICSGTLQLRSESLDDSGGSTPTLGRLPAKSYKDLDVFAEGDITMQTEVALTRSGNKAGVIALQYTISLNCDEAADAVGAYRAVVCDSFAHARP